MKKLLIIMGLMAMCLQGQAQFDRGFVRGMWDTRDAAQALRDNITNDLKHRTDKRQVLPNKKWLLDEDHFWTNGFVVFEAYYDEESHEIGINPQCDNPQEINDPMTVLSVKGTKVSKALNKNPITVERLGGHVMMVERNSQGQPISAYYMVTADEYNRGTWVLLLQQVLAGNYTTPNGSNVVFGPKMPFYSGDAWHTDPGVYVSFRPENDFTALSILYGDGRVSHGNPNSPNYGKVPGGGGAGALMGPMMWRVTPTIDGLLINVLHDEKFVDHNPRVEDNTTITHVQNPYEGLEGKWAFASVIPLTHQMLRLFPKEVLTLMRGEIYARHGDTFSDPKTQAYFDAQPWYKRSKRPVVLTDLERFNYALIKQVEQNR